METRGLHCRKHPVSVTDNGNSGADPVDIPLVPHGSRPPCDMETFTSPTNRNAQSICLTFRFREEPIMTACNRASLPRTVDEIR